MRHPKPYLKKSHHAWCYNQNGRPIRLCNEAEGEQVAWDKYYAIMAGRQPLWDDCRVFDLKERFINHLANNRSQRTYEFYAIPLESFVEFVGPNKRVYGLKAHHVTEWIDSCHKTAKRGRKVGKDENGKDKYTHCRQPT